MKTIVFLLLIFSRMLSSQSIDKFIQSLNIHEKHALESFSQNLLNSFAGYVLFGDKPLCIESIQDPHVPPIFCEPQVAQLKGFEIFSMLSSQNIDKKFEMVGLGWTGFDES